MLVYRCLSTAFLLTITFRQRATSWSSLDTGVVDILSGRISFCSNSKIYLDLLVIAYNKIAWEMGGGGGGGGYPT